MCLCTSLYTSPICESRLLESTYTLFSRLNGMSGRYAYGEVVLVVDGASWHRSGGLVVPSNIRLVCLPPYSPELNPVEQLWKGLRSRFFGNAYFESLKAVEDHLVTALRWVESNTSWVKSFAYYPYIQHAI
jgi:transposase